MVSYAVATLGLPRPAVLAALFFATLLQIFVVPLCGAMSDRFGRRSVYLCGAVMATLLALPACLLIDSRQVGLLPLGLVLGTLGPAVMFGPQAAFFAELFGTRIRYTGASLGFQLGAVLSGGLSPVIAATLTGTSSSLLPVGVYMLALGLISIASLYAATPAPAATPARFELATSASGGQRSVR